MFISWSRHLNSSSRRVILSSRRLNSPYRRVNLSSRRLNLSSRHVNLSSRRVVLSTRRVNSSSPRLSLSFRRAVFSTRRFVVPTCHLVVSNHRIVECRPLNSSSRRVNSSPTRTSRHFKYREDPVTEKADCASSSAHMRFWRFSCKMDELNAVKDILRDALSRIDQIPPQNSQNQNTSQSNQDHELPPSSNNTNVGLLARAQSNFR